MESKNQPTNQQKCLSIRDGDGKTIDIKNQSHSQCFLLWSLYYDNKTMSTVSSLGKGH